MLALFRLGEHVYALDGWIPLAGVAVLGRGLVGMPVGSPWSPRPLQAALRLMDGRCLDDPALSVACWPVRLEGARSGYSWGEWHHLKTVFYHRACPVIFVRDPTFLAREDGGKTFFGNNGQTFLIGCLSMTEREQEILALLRQDPMIAQQELADRLGISRSALASPSPA